MKRRSPGPQWEALKEPSASSSSSEDELNSYKGSSSVATLKRKGKLSEALVKRAKYGSLDDARQRVASFRSSEKVTSDSALAGSSRPASNVDSSRKRQKTSGGSNLSTTIPERRLTDGAIMSVKNKESNKGRHDHRSRDYLFSSSSSSSLSSSPFHFHRKEHSSREERREVKRPTSTSATYIEISDDDELILKASASSKSMSLESRAKPSAVGSMNGNRPRLSVARKKASWSSFRTAVRKGLPYQPQGTSTEDAIVIDDSDNEQVRYSSKANPESNAVPPSPIRVNLEKLPLALQSASSNFTPETVETDTSAVSLPAADPSRPALMSSSKTPTVSLTSGRGNDDTINVNRQPILSRQVWKKRSGHYTSLSTLATPSTWPNRYPEMSKQVQSSNAIVSTSYTRTPSTAGESGSTPKVSEKTPGQAKSDNHYTNSSHNEAISSLADAITQTQVLNKGPVGTSRQRTNAKHSSGDLEHHRKQALQLDEIAIPEASAYESSTSKSGTNALTPDPEFNSRYTMPHTRLPSGALTNPLEDTGTLLGTSGSRLPLSAASSTSKLSLSPFVLKNNDTLVTQNIDESKMVASAVPQIPTASDIRVDERTAAVPPKTPTLSTRKDLQSDPSSDNDAEPAGNGSHTTDSEAEINADLLAPLTIEDPASSPEPEEADFTRPSSSFGKPMSDSDENDGRQTRIRRSSRPSSRASSDDHMNGILSSGEGLETISPSYPSDHNLIPEETSGPFVPRVYGGFEALNWRSYCQTLKLSPPKCYFAVDLPHALQDNINSWTETARMDAGLRHVLEAAILENTADDEPDAPPIEIINEIDDEPTPPWEFYYSNKMWYGDGVPPPDITKLEGCNCVGWCDPRSQTCACLKRQQQYTPEFAYDARGRLKDFDYPIFECNDMCGCGDECRNRVVQHGRTCAISLSKTQHKGWGVFAGAKKISEGMFLGIYSGELLTDSESDQRGRLYNKFGRTYLFDLDFHHLKQGNEDDWDTKYVVDAYHAGNFTRFLNHSCDPNCKLVPCYINDPDIDKPLLAVFARRDINPFEEICFSYFGDLNSEDEEEQRTEGEDIGMVDSVYATCHCGTARCVGRLFT